MNEVCDFCDQPASLVCSQCLDAVYCSRDCQAADWEGHEATCVHPHYLEDDDLVHDVCLVATDLAEEGHTEHAQIGFDLVRAGELDAAADWLADSYLKLISAWSRAAPTRSVANKKKRKRNKRRAKKNKLLAKGKSAYAKKKAKRKARRRARKAEERKEDGGRGKKGGSRATAAATAGGAALGLATGGLGGAALGAAGGFAARKAYKKAKGR